MARERFIIILPASKREGYQYAKRAGIPARQCRIVTRANQITGLRVADVHMLPSFPTTPQRFAILSAFNRIRGIKDIVFYDVEMPPKPEVVEDQGDGMGPQLDIFDILDAQRETLGTGPVEKTVRVFTSEQVLELAAILDPGPLTDELYAMAYVEHEARGFELPTPSAEEQERVEQLLEDIIPEDEGPEPEAPKKRRRTRCPDCDQLRFPDDHQCEVTATKAATPRDRLMTVEF